MSELNELLTKIPLLPEWAKLLSLNLLGIYVVLQLVHQILKKLETPQIRALLTSLKELSGEGLRRVAQSLELPVERPRAAFVASAINVVLTYVFSLIFLAYFGLFLVLSFTAENIVPYKRLIGCVVAGGFFVITRCYFVSAERQRIALRESWKVLRERRNSSAVKRISCILDTNIFNWLLDGKIQLAYLPADADYFATYVQIGELSETTDASRRAALLLTFAEIRPKVVSTETFVLDNSVLNHTKLGEGDRHDKLKADLDVSKGFKPNNIQDALIADVAITNDYTLLTADSKLAEVAERHGCKVKLYEKRWCLKPRRVGLARSS